MSEFQPIPSQPDLNYQITEGDKARNLQKAPTAITPLEDVSHIERHWPKPDEVTLGSEFINNPDFENADELAQILESAASEIIPKDQYDRVHIITISFPHDVGRNGVAKIEAGESVKKMIRDSGKPWETEVNTVERNEKPLTNLVTCSFQPVFPLKGQTGEVKFQLRSAFPGEPAPRTITKSRKERYKNDTHAKNDLAYQEDKAWWDEHAFVVVK
ncbi:MAG: hypothetical protein ACOX6V_05420 [Patescibacteria group bacterium]